MDIFGNPADSGGFKNPANAVLNMNDYKIINLDTPTDNKDAANKVYVDSAISTGLPPGSNYSDYIYWDDSTSSYKSGGDRIHIGSSSGAFGQSSSAISIGVGSGIQDQKSNSIAIGTDSGAFNQSFNSVAIGIECAQNSQGESSVAVGQNAGKNAQGIGCVALGCNSSLNSQGDYACSLGFNAGLTNQPTYSVCLGSNSVCTLQHEVALGDSSCPQVKSHGYFVSDQGFKLSSGGSNTQYFTTDGGVGSPSGSGSSNIYLYNSSTNTNLLTITNGQIRYNQAVQPNASQIAISHLTRNGIDIDAFLTLAQINNILYIQDESTSLNYIKYKITGPPQVVPNNYYVFDVLTVDSQGTGSTHFPNGHNIILSIFTDTATIDSRLNTLDSEVLNLQNGKLSLSGGMMSGNIDMDNNAVENVNKITTTGTIDVGFNNTNGYNIFTNLLIGSGNQGLDADQILLGVSNLSNAGSNNTLAVGSNNICDSPFGIILGRQNTHGDTQQSQICIGYNNTTSGEGSMAFGRDITNSVNNSLCIGTSNMAWIFPNSTSCALGNPNTYPFKEIYIDGGVIRTGGTANDLYCADGTIDTVTINNAASALSLANNAVAKSGDTMTGVLNMGTNAITSSFIPLGNTDICNKLYVDNQVSGSLGANDTTQRYISSVIGNNANRGTATQPYLTISQGFANSAQYPLKLIIRGTFTENLSLVSGNSNLQITTLDSWESQQSTVNGTITTSGTFTRLRLSAFTLNGSTGKCLNITDTLGRHNFSNMYFSSSNASPISVSSSFTNWINFQDCDFTGLIGGPITLPNLTGTAILRMFNCGLVNISIGTGWTVYISGSTQLLSSAGSLNGQIIQLPVNLYNAVLTTQGQFNALSIDGIYINMVSGLTGLAGATLGCSFYRIGGINFLSLRYSQLPPTINVLNVSLSYDTWYKVPNGVGWQQLNLANYLPLTGGTLTGALAMGANKITSSYSAIDTYDVINKDYADANYATYTVLGDYLQKSGGTMTGDLDVNANNVQNVNTLTVNQITPTSSTTSDIGTSALPFRDFYINRSIKQSNYAFLDFQNYDTNYVGILFNQGTSTIATRSTSNWSALGSTTSNAPVYNLTNVFNRQPCTALFTTVALADGAPSGFVSTATTGISVNTGFSWGLQAFLGIADTAYNANNCQNFFGLWNTNTGVGLTQAIQLSTRTNFIAFGSNTTDTNLCIYTAGASSTVKQVDLGPNFPANRPSGSASVDFFRLSMYYNQSTGVVYYKVSNLNTGYNVVGNFTPAAGSMPLSSVALYPQINRTMGSPQSNGQAKLQVQRFGVLMF